MVQPCWIAILFNLFLCSDIQLIVLRQLSLKDEAVSQILSHNSNDRCHEFQNVALFAFHPLCDGCSVCFCLAQVVYLRKFSKLRTLNLTGNPLCDNEQYSMFIAAHLPDLVYLDFRLVDENTVSTSAAPVSRAQAPSTAFIMLSGLEYASTQRIRIIIF